ncbi:MAG: hypothetical protein P8Y34_09995 [Anaerolineales bacterium]
MDSKLKKPIFWIVLSLSILVLVAAGLFLTWRDGLVLRVADHYTREALQNDLISMDDCAECHEGADFHRCSTCHDEHGSVEFAELPFYNLILFSGDVPSPGYVEINQILPDRDHSGTFIRLLDFLEAQGVESFESVTMTSWDGGFVTISRENLSDQALLRPYTDGIRFADEDLHVSTWLKGISGFIVVGEERDLQVNGKSTSIGRLLLGPTRQVVVESARVMFESDTDGVSREAFTATRLWGAALSDLVPLDDSSVLLVSDQTGELQEFNYQEVSQAVLIAAAGGPTLVLPEQPRSTWIQGVVNLEWEK